MNIGELKELLEDLDDNMPVMLAVQPSWPFEHRTDYHATAIAENAEGVESFYIGEAGQATYLSGPACDEMVWGR